MRNFILAYGMTWYYSIDQAPNPIFYGSSTVLGGSKNEVSSSVAAVNATVAAGNPLATVTPSYPFKIQKLYVMLDRANVLSLLRTAAFGGGLYDAALGYWQNNDPNPPTFIPTGKENNIFGGYLEMIPDPKVSPRYSGWKDSAGVTRKPPPSDAKGAAGDFSGASGLVEAFLALEAYALVLQQSGRRRDAGIVRFAIDQVNKNIWSITEAFAYLRKQRLL